MNGSLEEREIAVETRERKARLSNCNFEEKNLAFNFLYKITHRK